MPPVEASSAASRCAFDGFPFTFAQEASRASAVLVLVLLVPVLAVIIVPVAMVFLFAAEDVLHALEDKPVAVGMLALGLIAWSALFLVPAHRLVRRFWRALSVRIAGDRVSVSETGLFSAKRWTSTLADFSGIAHRVRATLSGVRHELVLVHRDPRRTVAFYTADRISQSTIDRASALLQLPQLPVREFQRNIAHVPELVALAPAATEQAALT